MVQHIFVRKVRTCMPVTHIEQIFVLKRKFKSFPENHQDFRYDMMVNMKILSVWFYKSLRII